MILVVTLPPSPPQYTVYTMRGPDTTESSDQLRMCTMYVWCVLFQEEEGILFGAVEVKH